MLLHQVCIYLLTSHPLLSLSFVQPLPSGLALGLVPITGGSFILGSGGSKHSSSVSRLSKNAGMRQRPLEMYFHSTWSIQNTANLYRVNILYVQWIWEHQRGTCFLRQEKGNCINCLLSNKVILVLRKISKQQNQETAALRVINTFQIKTKLPYHIEEMWDIDHFGVQEWEWV